MAPDVSEAFLERFVNALALAASAQQRGADTLIVVSSDLKAHTQAISDLREHQQAMHAENNEERDRAVAQVLAAFKADAAERAAGERWYKRMVVILGLLILLSNLLSAPVGGILSKMAGITR